MEEFPSTYRPYGNDQKFETSKGNFNGVNQVNVNRPWSLDPPPFPPPPRTATKVSKASSAAKSWSFNDAELKRRKRVAKYKAYAVEGKLKASFRKGLRWIKNKCSEIVHG
ncbi:PREDICTED: uncharacterized protein LOC104598840 [Nelumbo nucifera]|uniref:Uncharacterized protein LOC104598840 n=1 Tax=Nelumbo nucifera TaxID=4432 RepID=A0A1U8Q688_NELNU|nr:PREDICTED: uncharacterized protein LOC104598840 [Nelumbo nucifera]